MTDATDGIEPASDELRELFAREGDVSAADRIAIRHKLAASVGAPASAAATTTTALATSKLALIAVAAIGAAAGGWWATHRTPAPAPTAAPTTTIETTPAPSPAPQPTPAQPAPELAAQPAPEPAAQPAPEPAAQPAPAPRVPAAAPSQAELLAKAWQSLTTDPAQALHLVELDARAHPHGPLAEERDALRIQALVAVGRTADARTLATTFLAAHPHSVHRKRIEAALQESP